MNAHRDRILRLPPNRVWRNYLGGRLLDEMEGREHPADGNFPEDWIGSTVRAINAERPDVDEGRARVRFGEQEAVLAELLEADPVYFLGTQHVARYGANPMVLVKYLDSAMRLGFQVHPTAEFAARRLGSRSGKTEAYYVLGTRPDVAEPCIYLGFARPPAREELRRMMMEGDTAAMERCFDRVRVKPGDVFLLPGGLAHAIGRGVLTVEIMEPSDLVVRMETKIGQHVVPEAARFMGRDIELALDVFSYEPLDVERCRCTPRLVSQTAGMVREALVDERVTRSFQVGRMRVMGASRWRADGFTILLLVEGKCTIEAGGEKVAMSKYDRIVVPHGMGEMEIGAEGEAAFIECRPPGGGEEG
jgi:mannose-6-phosphate isomerase